MNTGVINIVCSHQYNKFLNNIKEYSKDLGRAYTKKDEIKNTVDVNIKDIFVVDFYKKYNTLIYKTGVLGALSIYTNSNLDANQIIIFKDGIFYHYEIDLIEAEYNIEKNIAELVLGLEKNE